MSSEIEKEIVEKYKQGYSIPKLRNEYGFSYQKIHSILKKNKVNRSISEALLFKRKGWRKLIKMENGNTRILSLPGGFLEKLGFNKQEDLFYEWEILDKKLFLKIHRSYKSGYNKLVKSGESARILSLPIKFISEMNLNVEKELVGKWIFDENKLRLLIKEA